MNPLDYTAPSVSSSPSRLVAVTPDDDNDLTEVSKGIYVGASGDLAVVLAGDSSPVTLVGLAAGVFHKLRVKRVMATNTDATGIVAAY